MKTYFYKSIILSFFIILFGCQKTPDTNRPVTELVIGHWSWIKTIENPRTGEEINPQVTGFPKMIVFTNNNTVEEYINNIRTNFFTYKIEINKANPKMNVLTYNSISTHFYFSYDTLIFNEAYVDGPVSFYKRNTDINLPN
jgi:hypothetical protein